jgi:glycolate oxidase FAD binding subunit
VEPAVRGQIAQIAALARTTGAALDAVESEFWSRYARSRAIAPGDVVLRASTLASHITETAETIQRTSEALLDGMSPLITGCAAVGALRVLLRRPALPAVAALVERLREALRAIDGSVVVEGGPRALREALDPWGPVPPGPLALMRALKKEFDPKGVLNAGRFVAGL